MLPIDESARLASLHTLGLLDTPVEDRFDRITRMAQALFSVDGAAIGFIDSDRHWFKSRLGLEATEVPRTSSHCERTILDDDVCVLKNVDAELMQRTNTPTNTRDKIGFYASCAVHSPDGYRIGTLCVFAKSERAWAPRDQDLFIELAAMVDREILISSQITVDTITKVANRRGFTVVANHMLQLCDRARTPAELVLLNLNDFRKINEQHGHQTGDDMLQYFATMLSTCFRKADAIGRIGSNEFVVLMAGSEHNGHKALRRLDELAIKSNCSIQRQLSWRVGCVQFRSDRHSTIESLMADADSLMYDDRRRQSLAGAS